MGKWKGQSNKVCVTLNNYSIEELTELDNWLDENESNRNINFAIIREESGESGTIHLQGFIRLSRKFKLARECSLAFWRSVPGLARAHFEAAKGDDASQERYCSKDGCYKTWGESGATEKTDYEEVFDLAKENLRDAIEGYPTMAVKHYGSLRGINEFYAFQSFRNIEQSRYEGCKLRDWQQQALDLFLGQTDREILFCVDGRGNSGKSWLARYIIFTMDAW